jgi:hypothetical protein
VCLLLIRLVPGPAAEKLSAVLDCLENGPKLHFSTEELLRLALQEPVEWLSAPLGPPPGVDDRLLTVWGPLGSPDLSKFAASRQDEFFAQLSKFVDCDRRGFLPRAAFYDVTSKEPVVLECFLEAFSGSCKTLQRQLQDRQAVADRVSSVRRAGFYLNKNVCSCSLSAFCVVWLMVAVRHRIQLQFAAAAARPLHC